MLKGNLVNHNVLSTAGRILAETCRNSWSFQSLMERSFIKGLLGVSLFSPIQYATFLWFMRGKKEPPYRDSFINSNTHILLAANIMHYNFNVVLRELDCNFAAVVACKEWRDSILLSLLYLSIITLFK